MGLVRAPSANIPLDPRAGWLGWWPREGLRAALDPENGRIRAFLDEAARALPDGARVLDAGAGTRPYQTYFRRQAYESCDVPGGFYRATHDFECHLHAIPRPDTHYDAIVLTQVLEHVPDPDEVMRELARVTKPEGRLLMTVPLNSPLHGEPRHFFQFTHYGLDELASRTGWRMVRCEKIGGAFWLLGKRLNDLPRKLMKQVDPFRARKRGQSVVACAFWSLVFVPFWVTGIVVLGYVVRPLCYWLDRLDFEKSFTTGYTAVFQKQSLGPSHSRASA